MATRTDSELKTFCFNALVEVFAVCAASGAPVTLTPSFEGARQSNYQGNTRALTGAEADGADFVVTYTKTAVGETAWGVFSHPVPVAETAASYAFEFEIMADKDWINPETSGETWDNAINWLGADGKRIARRRLSLEFRKGAFAFFRFTGKVPEGARAATVQFGVDGPNISPGEKVAVRKTKVVFFPKGEKAPAERIPDLRPPVVRSRFTSPSEDARLRAVYEISDYTAVDWDSVAVTDVVTKAAIPFVRRGSRIALAPGAPWSAGRHLVDIAARDVLGNAAVSRKVFLIGERPSAKEVELRDDGMTLVGGKPFFPIGMYAVGPYEFNSNSLDIAVRDLKRAGVNTVHSYGHRFAPELFEAAAKHGARQWTSGHGARNEKDTWFMSTGRVDRTVLAWYIGDDTSMNTTPGQLLDRDEAVRMLDGTRITCHADGVRAGAAKSNYQEYVNFADVFMPEIYPIDGHKDERCVADVCRAMDRCWDDIRKYGDGERPRGVWPILQCFHGKGWKRYPTAQEMYAMSFAAIIHGGNGITWFKYGADIGENRASYSGMFRTPEDWAAMTNITTRIARLAPVLLERTPSQQPSPEILSGPGTDAYGSPSVTLLMKVHRGARYLLAVNAVDEKVRARIVRCGGSAKVRVAWEHREIDMADGAFEDDFEPFGVHVYRF